MRNARVALLLDEGETLRRWRLGLNVFEAYAEEVLLQAGIPFKRIASIEQVNISDFDIVVAALVGEDDATAQRLLGYMERGGVIVALANVNMLARRFGYGRGARITCGYARFGDKYGKAEAIRFLDAVPWQIRSAGPASDGRLEAEFGQICLETPNGKSAGAALSRYRVGAGLLERWAVDIFGTCVHMQQGTAPVLEDGFPAPDGSAAIDDGLLKAEDGVVLDWTYDRLATDTGIPYFPYPYVDYWRELLANRLIDIALERGLTIPIVDYWPAGIEQVAMISHDSDLNGDDNAETALKLLAECGVRSTWCMIAEGYSSDMYGKITEAGHELALHFNALEGDGGKWSEEEFVRQLSWFAEATGLSGAVSNKNHFTRFEGWGDLFVWCEKYGVESDQTRGPSKKGNVGMLYGTCHPYFPIAWSTERNRIYDVVEIGFLTQDLDLSDRWPDSSVIIPFLDRVRSVEGVAHFLVHQVHIGNHESVRESMRRIVHEARKRKFTFLTGRQINDWIRVRRAYVANLFDKMEAAVAAVGGEGDPAMRASGKPESSACHQGEDLAMRASRMPDSSGRQPVVWIPVIRSHGAGTEMDCREKFGHLCRPANWQGERYEYFA